MKRESIEYMEQHHSLNKADKKLGSAYKEVQNFKIRCNKSQRKLAAGIEIKSKG